MQTVKCIDCDYIFIAQGKSLVNQLRMNGIIIRSDVKCPHCSALFSVNADLSHEATLANPASTVRPLRGKKGHVKPAYILPRHSLSSDWYDYESPQLHNCQSEVDYLNSLALERDLTADEQKQYNYWYQMLETLLEKQKEAEQRLIERGEL